jgi:G3E family GTPase
MIESEKSEQLQTSKAKPPVNDKNRKVSVYIITGFLGSGKTTLLNGFLRQLKSSNNFIIENEFGQVNIDKELVSGNFQKVFEITNGCLCCNLDADLYDALDQIARLDQKPDNLFIETTGIADAGNLSAIFAEDFVKEVFDLKKIICMIDVEVIEDFLEKTSEAARQIVASDLVILNKIKLVSPEYKANVAQIIRKLNPYAHITEVEDGILGIDKLELSNPDKPLFSIDHNSASTNGHDINSVLYESEGAFDMEKLEILLRTSLYIYYRDIFRIKGFVKNKRGEVFLLQSAGKTISVVASKQAVEKSHLVFIGRKLTEEIVKRLLRSVQIPAID